MELETCSFGELRHGAAVRSPVSHHGLVRGGAVPQLAEGAGFELHTCLMRRISAMRRSDGVSLGGALRGHRVCVFCTAVLRGPPAAVTSQLVVGRQKRTTNSVPRFWELAQKTTKLESMLLACMHTSYSGLQLQTHTRMLRAPAATPATGVDA